MNTTINTITENTTLGDLISILGNVTKEGKLPTAKTLLEEAGEPIASEERCKVYANGYAVYIGNYLSNKKCRVINADGTSKWVDNDGLVDQILIEGHHEALVSKELHEVVGELVKGGTLGGNRRQFSAEERETMSRAMKLAAREAKSWQMVS